MNLTEAIRTSIAEILGHKLRSILTLVGIVLGTTALVVMVSVIGGAALAVQKGLTDLGFDGVMFVTAQPATDRLEKKKQGYSRGLRTADLRTIDAGKELIGEAAYKELATRCEERDRLRPVPTPHPADPVEPDPATAPS